MDTMYIGSGDTTALLSGLNTETHYKLLRRFVGGVKPYYNAKNSPIDALRTGAILEDRYFTTLPDNYYTQYAAVSGDMDVLRCSLDFAKLDNGEVVDFEELKSCNFNDFLAFEQYRDNPQDGVEFIKRRYKNNYHQIQQQLYCTALDEANLVFLAVYSYDDHINITREIKNNEYIKFRIHRDETVIQLIKERASIFQDIKNHYKK